MQYKSTTKSSQTVVAIAGNLNENYKSAEEAGYGKTWGLQKMVSPTGQIFKLRKAE
jgi:glycerate kinase